jgi:hypothetical protein
LAAGAAAAASVSPGGSEEFGRIAAGDGHLGPGMLLHSLLLLFGTTAPSVMVKTRVTLIYSRKMSKNYFVPVRFTFGFCFYLCYYFQPALLPPILLSLTGHNSQIRSSG